MQGLFQLQGLKITNHSGKDNVVKKIKLRASNDEGKSLVLTSWDDLDECLKNPNSTCLLWINDYQKYDYYNYFRIEIDGRNTSDNYQLCLKQLEIYGSFKCEVVTTKKYVRKRIHK